MIATNSSPKNPILIPLSPAHRPIAVGAANDTRAPGRQPLRCGGASVVLSEQPPALAGYPPDRPDPPRYRFMFSLWVNGLRRQCQNPANGWRSVFKITGWCSFTVTRQQSLSAMQAAARYTEGADAPDQGASVFTVQIRSENHPAVQYQGVACRRSPQRSVSAWKASGRAPVFPYRQQ